MKGILSKSFVYNVVRTANAAAGSDKVLTQIDTGNSQNGTLIIVADVVASSSMDNVEVWTSRLTAFASAGTQVTAVTSDSTKQILITSDADTLWANTTAGTALTTALTVASNKISSISEDGCYVINIKDCAKFLSVQYDSDGTGSYATQVFIGHDLLQAPYAGARTAF